MMLPERLEARDTEGLEQIAAFVHDERFELEGLAFDAAEGTLLVPFAKECREELGWGSSRWHQLLFQRWSVPATEYVLEIGGVRALVVDDPAEIGTYTFDTIRYDEQSGELVIVACEDLKVRVSVDEISLAVVATGRSVGEHRYVTVLGCEIGWGEPRLPGASGAGS